MPTVHSKFDSYILPTYEKVYRWYEGLDTPEESESEFESEPEFESENPIYFKPEMCFTFYERGPESY